KRVVSDALLVFIGRKVHEIPAGRRVVGQPVTDNRIAHRLHILVDEESRVVGAEEGLLQEALERHALARAGIAADGGVMREPGALHGDKLAARVLPQEEPENQFVKTHDAPLSMSLSSSLRLSGSAFEFRSHVLIWFKAGSHTVAKMTGG